MGLLDRFRRRRTAAPAAGTGRTPDAHDEQHLRTFVETHEGVEGFVEPRTTVTDVTFLLVAHDGEWTRRHVSSPEWAYKWARKQGIAAYDAAVVGLPARMREYNRRQKLAEKERLERFLDGPEPGGPDGDPDTDRDGRPQ
ncbi:MAG TPA: hypothetical protein VFK34_02360 [Marmoricola sp.]|jgi:hypothetical protein|nr:hypothetical protein [Marmoricola sp.]